MNKLNKMIDEEDEEEEEKEEAEEIPFIRKKDNDEDEDDEDFQSFGTPKGNTRKSSYDYNLKIAKLQSEKDQLLKEIENLKVEIPNEITKETHKIINEIKDELKDKLKKYEEEVEYYKNLEETAKRELKEITDDYNEQLEELRELKSSKKQLDELKKNYANEYSETVEKYETLKAESAYEIEELKKEYENTINTLKKEKDNLRKETLNKNEEIKNLRKAMEEGNRAVNEIIDELNSYKQKYFDLEEKSRQEIQSMNQLAKGSRTMSKHEEQIKNQEIKQMRNVIDNLDTDGRALRQKIDELVNELEQTKIYAETEYDKLKKENEDDLLYAREEIENMKQMLQRKASNNIQEYENRFHEQQRMIQEKDMLIQRLNEELNRKITPSASLHQLQDIILEEKKTWEGKMEEEFPKGMQTRSQGPANTGQEIIQEIFDEKGNMIWKGMTFELAEKKYDASEYIMNLIKHNKSNPIKNFKLAFENRQRTLGDKSTFNNQKYADKAVDILEEQFNNDKQKVAMVMKYIIDSNPNNIVAEFNKKYMKNYAQYIKKIS